MSTENLSDEIRADVVKTPGQVAFESHQRAFVAPNEHRTWLSLGVIEGEKWEEMGLYMLRYAEAFRAKAEAEAEQARNKDDGE